MLLRLAAIACITPGLLSCGADAATGPEPLPQTLATVQAAVDMISTGHIPIVGTCAGATPFNCPGGTLAAPVNLNLTRIADSVALVAGQSRYDFSVTVSAASASGIPLTIPLIGDCTLSINTAPGTSPTIRLTGSVTFSSQQAAGPIDRVDFSNFAVFNVEAADVVLSGSTACAATTFPGGTVATQLLTFFAQNSTLCSAPGPTLLQPCPVTLASAKRE